METKQKTTLTQGSVARGMLLFALPIFISNLFQQLYNAADSLIVGNFLGGEALAAVGSSGSLIFLLTGFVNGVSLGAGVVVARYFGAKDWDRMRRTIHTTVALGLVAGVGLTVIGVILTPQILRWMGTPDDVLVNSIAYFRMYFIGSIAVVMYNVGASILQSVGDSKSPMRYLIAASLINIVLDLILVGWLRMGVAAAAFATIASQTVSAVLAFAKLTRSQEAWAVHWSEVKFDGPSLKAVIVQGLPSGIQNSVISIANVIVQSNINSFGAQAMACAPNELMLDCTMTLAIEMTEFWMPDGRPCTMTAFSDGPSNFTSLQCTAHASWERVSLANARTALTVWEAIVANAAAATPMRSQPTRIRSSTMLMREAAIKYRIGLLLSPTDCRMLAPTLYMTTAIEPMKYMRK